MVMGEPRATKVLQKPMAFAPPKNFVCSSIRQLLWKVHAFQNLLFGNALSIFGMKKPCSWHFCLLVDFSMPFELDFRPTSITEASHLHLFAAKQPTSCTAPNGQRVPQRPLGIRVMPLIGYLLFGSSETLPQRAVTFEGFD